MKKIVVLLLAVAMVLSVVAFAACAQSEKVTGEYHYANAWDKTAPDYGAKVDVTVSNGKITAVKLYTDEESGYVNLSAANDKAGWTEEDRKVWTDGVQAYLDSFVGMTVEEVNAATATIQGVGDATSNSVSIDHVTGATQSSARVLLAIQNALSKLSK